MGDTKEYICVHPPFDQRQEFICVEYPAVIKSHDKMMKTLGGTKKVTKTYRQRTKQLELCFRPDDPCAKPTLGDITQTKALLVRIRKYCRKVRSAGGPEEILYRPEVIGIINTTYKFQRMFDFQYLSVSKNPSSGAIESMLPHIRMSPELIDESIFDQTNDSPLFVPPLCISRFDKPQNIIYQKKVVPVDKEKEEEKEKNRLKKSAISVIRKRRYNNAIAWDITSNDVPKEPMPTAIMVLDRSRSIKVSPEIVQKIADLFKERPIWSKSGLSYCAKATSEKLKLVLPTIAFYYTNGPWRTLWVRFGYNPKFTKQALMYQLIEYRVRRATDLNMIKAKRSQRLNRIITQNKNFNANVLSRKHLGVKSPSVIEARKKTKEQESVENLSVEIYKYIPGHLPPHRQMFYQYMDIELPEVKSLIEYHLYQVKENEIKCGEKSGWLPDGIAAIVRDKLDNDVGKTLKSMEDSSEVLSETVSESDAMFEEEELASSEYEEDETDVSSDNDDV